MVVICLLARMHPDFLQLLNPIVPVCARVSFWLIIATTVYDAMNHHDTKSPLFQYPIFLFLILLRILFLLFSFGFGDGVVCPPPPMSSTVKPSRSMPAILRMHKVKCTAITFLIKLKQATPDPPSNDLSCVNIHICSGVSSSCS